MSESSGPSQPAPQPRLSPADASALDALVESGWAPSHEDPRGERLASLLSLLQPPAPAAGAKQDLVNLTMARILRAQPRRTKPAPAALIPDDEEALDALVACGMDPEQTPASLRERARVHAELARLVARGPSDHAGTISPAKADLISRTLAAVQAHRDSELQAQPRFERARGRGRSLSLRDLVSVAAVVMIGASVIWPVAAGLRHAQRQSVCGSNLASAAGGFGMYAGVHRDALPVATAGLGGLGGVGNAIGRWWDVGNRQATSNSANLYTLTRTGYTPLASLACPGNPNAPTGDRGPDEIDWRSLGEVSYSYQIMFGAPPPAWRKGPNDVILADRSPVVLRAVRGDWIDPLESSPNHLARGQHMLRADGAAIWAEKPVCEDGDNIWLPRAIEQAIRDVATSRKLRPIEGRETPSDTHDTFLGP
jgi:hypothetical protein